MFVCILFIAFFRHLIEQSNHHCLSNKLAGANFYFNKALEQSLDKEEQKRIIKKIDLWKAQIFEAVAAVKV